MKKIIIITVCIIALFTTFVYCSIQQITSRAIGVFNDIPDNFASLKEYGEKLDSLYEKLQYEDCSFEDVREDLRDRVKLERNFLRIVKEILKKADKSGQLKD
jgi:hypothetical protein